MPKAEKTTISDLALFGGTPTFSTQLHVGAPNVGNRARLLNRVNESLNRRWLSNNGPLVRELESRIAERLGVRNCIALCNGTVALEVAIHALGLSGEVIVPSFTFVATAHALRWVGIRPVFCDIDPGTHRLDPEALESQITGETSGIIAVHTWGEACAIPELSDIARRHGLKLIFDAAHAFDCSWGARAIGGFGDAEVFSFHATKFFHTFEGGAVTTNDDEFAERVRLMRNFGFAGYDNVISLGTNGKMNEISAAMGLTNLESLTEFVEINEMNYHFYRESLAGIPGMTIFPIGSNGRSNFQYVVLEVDQRKAGLSRDAMVRVLHAENVLARRYFYPGCHRMHPYAGDPIHQRGPLHSTELLCSRVMVLPTGSTVDRQCIASICNLIKFAVENSKQIARETGA